MIHRVNKVGVVRQAESAALKAAGLTESGKKSGTFKRELVAVFTQVCCRQRQSLSVTLTCGTELKVFDQTKVKWNVRFTVNLRLTFFFPK